MREVNKEVGQKFFQATSALLEKNDGPNALCELLAVTCGALVLIIATKQLHTKNTIKSFISALNDELYRRTVETPWMYGDGEFPPEIKEMFEGDAPVKDIIAKAFGERDATGN